MKNLMTWAAGTLPLFSSSPSFAQGGSMMNGGWWGSSWMDGYSWYVMAIVMIAVVVLVVWAVGQDKK